MNKLQPKKKFLKEIGQFELLRSKYFTDSDRLQCLERMGRRFARTRDPIEGLEILCAAERMNLDIPEPVIAWLAKASAAYLKGRGNDSMDKQLGLTRVQGNDSALRAYHLKKRDSLFMSEMFVLCSLGMSIRQASVAVESLMADTEWDHTGLALGNLSAATLEDRYRKLWRPKQSGKNAQAIRNWSYETIRSHLDRFPRHAFEVDVKQRLLRQARLSATNKFTENRTP